MSLRMESATFGRVGMHVANNSTPFPHPEVRLLEENRLDISSHFASMLNLEAIPNINITKVIYLQE